MAILTAEPNRELRIMVQIVEKEEDAAGADRIEFRIIHTQTGHIRGQWQDARDEPGGLASIAHSEPMSLIGDEFRRVIIYADSRQMPFIWVNDPQGLFPPSKRAVHLVLLIEKSGETERLVSPWVYPGSLTEAITPAQQWTKNIREW